MELYTASDCVHCHRVRFVLAEKGISVRIIELEQQPGAKADLAELNPYGDTPTLVDRDILLYGTWVICEYLDERYPHPPLMPVDPISRARLRLALYRIQRDWFSRYDSLLGATGRPLTRLRKEFAESIGAADDLFAAAEYILNDELSLVDCALAPLLWRLPAHGINLSKVASHVSRYSERLFQRDSFRASLTETERDLGR